MIDTNLEVLEQLVTTLVNRFDPVIAKGKVCTRDEKGDAIRQTSSALGQGLQTTALRLRVVSDRLSDLLFVLAL